MFFSENFQSDIDMYQKTIRISFPITKHARIHTGDKSRIFLSLQVAKCLILHIFYHFFYHTYLDLPLLGGIEFSHHTVGYKLWSERNVPSGLESMTETHRQNVSVFILREGHWGQASGYAFIYHTDAGYHTMQTGEVCYHKECLHPI